MHTLLAGALLGTSFLRPACAAQPRKAAPETTKQADAAADPFVWKSSETLSLQAVLAHFELFDRELRSLSASFTQTMSMANTGMSSSVEGTVAYLKPDRLRIQHTKPERQTVVSDGKDIWIHRLSQNQVIQSNLNAWKQADPMIANLMQFGSYASMLKSYDVRLDTASTPPTAAGQAGAAPTLVLRPKTKQEAPFELRLALSQRTLFPQTTELSVGDMTIRTRLDSIEFNPPLEESQFRFVPPAGADVFRDFKPPKFRP